MLMVLSQRAKAVPGAAALQRAAVTPRGATPAAPEERLGRGERTRGRRADAPGQICRRGPICRGLGSPKASGGQGLRASTVGAPHGGAYALALQAAARRMPAPAPHTMTHAPRSRALRRSVNGNRRSGALGHGAAAPSPGVDELPGGAGAWMVETFHAWRDGRGDIERGFRRMSCTFAALVLWGIQAPWTHTLL